MNLFPNGLAPQIKYTFGSIFSNLQIFTIFDFLFFFFTRNKRKSDPFLSKLSVDQAWAGKRSIWKMKSYNFTMAVPPRTCKYNTHTHSTYGRGRIKRRSRNIYTSFYLLRLPEYLHINTDVSVYSNRVNIVSIARRESRQASQYRPYPASIRRN